LISAVGGYIDVAHHNRQMAIALEKLMQQRRSLGMLNWRHLVVRTKCLSRGTIAIETLVEKKLDWHRPDAKMKKWWCASNETLQSIPSRSAQSQSA